MRTGRLCLTCCAAALLAAAAATPPADAIRVINKGFSGRNSRDALKLLDAEVLPLKAQHAVLFFGMNDAMNSANLLPLGQFETNLVTLVTRLQAGGARTVALVTIHPVIEEYVRARHPKHPQRDTLQSHLAAYDQAVRRLAQSRRLPLVDLRAWVERNGGAAVAPDSPLRCEANGGGRDGVHLTPAAYAQLGRLAHEALASHVRPGETVVCFGDSLTFGASVKGAGTATGETYPAALQRRFEGAP